MDNHGKAIFSLMFDDDSDNEEHHQKVIQAIAYHTSVENEATEHGGSVAGREYKNCEREDRHHNLISNYFVEMPHFNTTDFRRQFRMWKELFYRILNDVVNHKPYFLQKKKDGLDRQGLSPEKKLIVVFRMLVWGCSADATDEYCRLGESTSLESLRKFCCAVEAAYGKWYLRSQNPADLYRLLHKASRRGFLGMLGSLDCMHWEWKNCQSAWASQFTDHKKPTVVLKVVASYDTWIWHAFFGVAGSNNDINILARSPLFNDMVHGVAPHVEYIVNRNQYHLGYYLADGIYPRWATLVKTIYSPYNPKNRLFAQMLEAYRKDVERAFGIL